MSRQTFQLDHNASGVPVNASVFSARNNVAQTPKTNSPATDTFTYIQVDDLHIPLLHLPYLSVGDSHPQVEGATQIEDANHEVHIWIRVFFNSSKGVCGIRFRGLSTDQYGGNTNSYIMIGSNTGFYEDIPLFTSASIVGTGTPRLMARIEFHDKSYSIYAAKLDNDTPMTCAIYSDAYYGTVLSFNPSSVELIRGASITGIAAAWIPFSYGVQYFIDDAVEVALEQIEDEIDDKISHAEEEIRKSANDFFVSC